jgi:putative membrane protein
MMGYGVGMGLGWIVMVLFWVLLIGLIVWGVTRLVPTSTARPERYEPTESAQEILDRRFANGELDVAEYTERRQQLAASRKGGGK